MEKKGGPEAANRLKKDLGQLFRFAAKRYGFAGQNPATLADSHKVRSAGFHTWTDGESDTFRAKHETGSKARLALELLFGTGAALVYELVEAREERRLLRLQKQLVLFRRLSEDGFSGLFCVVGAWISHIGSSLPDRGEAGVGRTRSIRPWADCSTQGRDGGRRVLPVTATLPA